MDHSSDRRRYLIDGATGFVGRHLVASLASRGDEIVAKARDPARARHLFGDRARVVADLHAIGSEESFDGLVNLAGEPILARPWTRSRRRALVESRTRGTRELVEFCGRAHRRPPVLVNASAIGFYGVRGDELIDESADPQPIFQSQLCLAWEQAAEQAASLGIRVVRLRIGIVLGRDGGAFPPMARPVRAGLGAVLGNGRQWFSWVHIDDLVRLILFALDTPALDGAVNATAPEPVRHREFQRSLAKHLRRPLWLRMPAPLLRVAMGEMSQLLLDGQRVVPTRALAAGFVFRYPAIGPALDSIL